MNITILTTIFPRHKDDYRGSFIGFLAKSLSRNNKNVSIKVIAPSGRESMLKEIWDGLRICIFNYWIPQSKQCIAYSDKDAFSSLTENYYKFFQLPSYLINFFITILKSYNSTDVFHCQWTFTAIFPIIINKLLFFFIKKPIIVTCRGSDLRLLPGWLNRFIFRNVSAVTYVSPMFTINRYKNKFGTDIIKYIEKNTTYGAHSIFDPLDESKFLPNKKDLKNELGLNQKKIILWLANFTELKNPIYGLGIINKLKKYRTDFCMIMVGFGSGEAEIKKYILENNLDGFVMLLGPKSDVQNYYDISDLFLATNKFDNVWSSTIAESMFIGCPVVMTDVGYSKYVFKDKFDSFFIPVEDTKTASKILDKIMNDDNVLNEISKNAKLTLKKYRRYEDQAVKDYLTLYKKVLLS